MEVGAGDGNRTHVASLEGWSSTIELHPHAALILMFSVGMSTAARGHRSEAKRGSNSKAGYTGFTGSGVAARLECAVPEENHFIESPSAVSIL